MFFIYKCTYSKSICDLWFITLLYNMFLFILASCFIMYIIFYLKNWFLGDLGIQFKLKLNMDKGAGNSGIAKLHW